MFTSLEWIIVAINQSESKLVKARTMLFTFLILAFGYIFNVDVCESKFDMKEFLSNPMASIMKPITYPKSTYGKSGFSEPEFFKGGHLKFFSDLKYRPSVFSGWRPRKTSSKGVSEPKPEIGIL